MARKIIISFTSTLTRAGTLDPTIESIRQQTVQPDEVRLYIAEGVPAPAGVDVRRTVDYGPVTKISALVVDPDPHAIVVTIDDDQVYAPTWLATLLAGVDRFAGTAVGFAGWDVASFLDDPTGGNYIWSKNPGPCDVVEGWAGVAYPPSCLDATILDPPDEFRWVDDVWISSRLFKRRVHRHLLGTPMSHDPQRRPGLHHRGDFVALNRRAAILGFSP